MDILALVISALSLAVAAVGTFQANRRAKEALDESRSAAADARWTAVQAAVQRLIGFDPTDEPIDQRLVDLRIAMIGLVDHLEDWDGLDGWLEAERALGATLGREVMDAARPDDSVEQRLNNLMPMMSWAQALSQNLRCFRSVGHDRQALSALETNAATLIRDVHARHGWDLPPSTNPHLEVLDD